MSKQIDLLNSREPSTTEQAEQPRLPKLDLSLAKNQTSKWSEFKITGKNILIRSCAAACAIGSIFYVYGGMQILNGILSDFHWVDLDLKSAPYEWKQVKLKEATCTPGPRAKHGMVAIDKAIYLVGGITGHNQVSNQMFTYNIEDGKWTELKPKGQPLPHIDSFAYTTAGKKIYIVCGYEGKKCRLLNSVYQYDTETNTCTLLFQDHPEPSKSIPSARSNCAIVTDGSKLYLFGGKSDQKRLNDLWSFDLATKTFSEIKIPEESRPIFRSGHTLNYFDGNIYLFGGIHEVTWELNDLFFFNIKNKLWQSVEVQSSRKKEHQTIKTSSEKQGEKKLPPLKKRQSNFYDTYMEGSLLSPTKKLTQSPTPSTRTNGFHFQQDPTEVTAGVSPGKMIDEQRKKAFLAKKTEMLKVFDVQEKDKTKYFKIQSITQAMRNSLDIIGDPNPKGNHPSPNKLTEFGKTTCSKFLQPLGNHTKMIYGKKPCARDGHNTVLVQGNLIIFGGDRHQMSFNDIYKLDIGILLKEASK